jgi:hypothetical protein
MPCHQALDPGGILGKQRLDDLQVRVSRTPFQLWDPGSQVAGKNGKAV